MLREQLGHSPYIMWHWHRRTSIQQYAQYLEVVLVGRQHQWRNVRRKHGRIYVHCLPALWKKDQHEIGSSRLSMAIIARRYSLWR